MITRNTFFAVLEALGPQGRIDVEWAQKCAPPQTAEAFALEAIFVICNSGMQNKVAWQIYYRVVKALEEGRPVAQVFGHVNKVKAIEYIWLGRYRLFTEYCGCTTPAAQLDYLAKLPHIGGITKYHLAKNFGLPFAKPDVHLVRLANREGVTAQELCERLARETGYSVAVVDTILWRACATGVINSKTGDMRI